MPTFSARLLAASAFTLLSLGPMTAGAQPTAALPSFSPERMELGAGMVRASHLDSAARLGTEVAWRAQREKIETMAKSAPPERARKILAVWDSAVAEGQQAFVDGLIKRLQAYFAASNASDEQLTAYIGLYDSDLGRRIAPPNVASPEDRQAAGKYLVDHPKALEALPVVFGATDVITAYVSEHREALSRDVVRRFCQGLFEAGLTKTPNCMAA